MAKDGGGGGDGVGGGGGRGDDGGGGGRRVDTAGTLRPLPLSLSLSVVVWWMCGRCCFKQKEIRSAHPLRQDVTGVVNVGQLLQIVAIFAVEELLLRFGFSVHSSFQRLGS